MQCNYVLRVSSKVFQVIFYAPRQNEGCFATLYYGRYMHVRTYSQKGVRLGVLCGSGLNIRGPISRIPKTRQVILKRDLMATSVGPIERPRAACMLQGIQQM